MHVPISFANRFALLLPLACCFSATAFADVPSFVTIDPRLPNPDRPYDMTDGRVEFLAAHDMGLYDLEFQATNPDQLDVPTQDKAGNWKFESIYDVAYEVHLSFGLGPVHRVIGMGRAHVRGVSPASNGPWVFDTELIALDLQGLSPRPDFLFRESPTLRSTGKTIVADACPQCDAMFPIYRVSSFIDIFAEASADGGMNWAPADMLIHVVQQAEPVVFGDYNQNGTVDAADYVMWRKRLGPGALPNEGGVSNNVVDEADYRFWHSRFGATVHVPFSPLLPAAVPEPATWAVLSIAALFSMVSRRRKRAIRRNG